MKFQECGLGFLYFLDSTGSAQHVRIKGFITKLLQPRAEIVPYLLDRQRDSMSRVFCPEFMFGLAAIRSNHVAVYEAVNPLNRNSNS